MDLRRSRSLRRLLQRCSHLDLAERALPDANRRACPAAIAKAAFLARGSPDQTPLLQSSAATRLFITRDRCLLLVAAQSCSAGPPCSSLRRKLFRFAVHLQEWRASVPTFSDHVPYPLALPVSECLRLAAPPSRPPVAVGCLPLGPLEPPVLDLPLRIAPSPAALVVANALLPVLVRSAAGPAGVDVPLPVAAPSAA